MYTCRLNRQEDNYKYGTFGVFLLNSQVFCVTLEPAYHPYQQGSMIVCDIPQTGIQIHSK